jgi:Ca-activated chloride channel family protein
VKFDWPLALLALAALPLAAAAYVLVERRRSRFALRYTNVDVLASVAPVGPASWRRFGPPALLLLAVAVAVFALARPQMAHSVARQQATVVLVLDTSGSMVANDVEPTRLGAAQEAVRGFLKRLPDHYRVGMVTFSTSPRVAMPLTDDHSLAAQGLDHLVAFGGTAIGDAVARAVTLLRPKRNVGTPAPRLRPRVTGPPAAIVLLSDGAQNRGYLRPLEGAARAKDLKIPVYTVALGTPSGTIRLSDGPFTQDISVPPDPQTLRQIALETGGEFYAAASSARLNAVYEKLASRLSVRREYRESTYLFLGVSAALLLGAGALSAFWLPRLP